MMNHKYQAQWAWSRDEKESKKASTDGERAKSSKSDTELYHRRSRSWEGIQDRSYFLYLVKGSSPTKGRAMRLGGESTLIVMHPVVTRDPR